MLFVTSAFLHNRLVIFAVIQRKTDTSTRYTDYFVSSSRKECRTDKHVMFGAVHMTKRQSHHFLNNLDGILRGFCKANAHDAVHSLRMALVAYVVAILTDRLAVLFFVTDGTFHQLVIFQIFQRRTAKQAFIFHIVIPFSLYFAVKNLNRDIKFRFRPSNQGFHRTPRYLCSPA